jgi:hypothetical protein
VELLDTQPIQIPFHGRYVFRFPLDSVGLICIAYRRKYHTLLVHLTEFLHNLSVGLYDPEGDDVSEASQDAVTLAPRCNSDPKSYWPSANVGYVSY